MRNKLQQMANKNRPPYHSSCRKPTYQKKYQHKGQYNKNYNNYNGRFDNYTPKQKISHISEEAQIDNSFEALSDLMEEEESNSQVDSETFLVAHLENKSIMKNKTRHVKTCHES